jgi:hypothetical protein
MWTKEQYKAQYTKANEAYKNWLKRPWWFQEKEPIARFTGYVGLFTFVLAVVAGLQTCVLSNQLNEIRDDRRAWLAPISINVVEIASGKPVRLSVSIANSGRTPATQLIHRFSGQTLDVPKGAQVTAQWIKPQIPENSSCENGKIIDGNTTIYPSATLGYLETVDTLGDRLDVVDALVKGDKTAYWQGCLSYRTAEHAAESRYCFFLVPNADGKGGWNYGYCPSGNSAK